MKDDRITFECMWCKEAGVTPEEYTYFISELCITVDGEEICENCCDTAKELLNDY